MVTIIGRPLTGSTKITPVMLPPVVQPTWKLHERLCP